MLGRDAREVAGKLVVRCATDSAPGLHRRRRAGVTGATPEKGSFPAVDHGWRE